MKKELFSVLASLGISLLILFGVNKCAFPLNVVHAAEDLESSIKIEDEYIIPDKFDWCTYYVLVATNNTGKDVEIDADFTAYNSEKSVVSLVHDRADAVKAGQRFILYGQFLNKNIKKGVSFAYSLNATETDNCTYNMVDIDTSSKEQCIEVSATNYSEKDIQGVGIRTLFTKNGKAVAFDTVNIADVGYIFRGGSTNSQIIGLNASDYDNYIITYISAGVENAQTF
ncbi:hypothetical protein SAMN04487928_10944 [Butyrivibrio proteoclasticus]|uniref:Uncharacterized protein n=1 Tax=Butyrivibrio proteoclasticus TaxID=43305 RepID=A0A1I5TI90_9FIRM|nr:hypothetical protein [Butyrivibrio proteoclasticus]SFP82648.1 hypothetical protein SAMN04487928_10944 [Butyrivibrio proteoclasticus]